MFFFLVLLLQIEARPVVNPQSAAPTWQPSLHVDGDRADGYTRVRKEIRMRTPSWVLALLMLATPALSAAAEEMSYLFFSDETGSGTLTVTVKCEAVTGCGPFTVFVRNLDGKVLASKPFPNGATKSVVFSLSFKVPKSEAAAPAKKTYKVTVEMGVVRVPSRLRPVEKESAKFSSCRSRSSHWISPRSDPGRNPNPPPDPDEKCRFNGRAFDR
jgi:hypothetical protein